MEIYLPTIRNPDICFPLMTGIRWLAELCRRGGQPSGFFARLPIYPDQATRQNAWNDITALADTTYVVQCTLDLARPTNGETLISCSLYLGSAIIATSLLVRCSLSFIVATDYWWFPVFSAGCGRLVAVGVTTCKLKQSCKFESKTSFRRKLLPLDARDISHPVSSKIGGLDVFRHRFFESCFSKFRVIRAQRIISKTTLA